MCKTFLSVIWIMALIKRDGMGLFIEKVRKGKQKACNYQVFVKKAYYINQIFNNRVFCKIFQVGCLKKSLILFYIARIYGVKLVLEFGSRHITKLGHEPILSGHAWVKYHGKPFMEKLPIDQYIIMYHVSNM